MCLHSRAFADTMPHNPGARKVCSRDGKLGTMTDCGSGNGTLSIERFIDNPRHAEVQWPSQKRPPCLGAAVQERPAAFRDKQQPVWTGR